jgi:hypothetical protein
MEYNQRCKMYKSKVAVRQKALYNSDKWYALNQFSEEPNPHIVPEEPITPTLPKLKLFILLLELITQTYLSILNFS